MKNNNWKKTFWIVWAGQAFSILGSSIVQFALVWYLTDKTGSAWVLTLATLAALLPQGLIAPFIGPLIDRYDRKKIMIIADMGIACATLVLVIAGIFGEVPVAIIMFVIIARSVGSAFHAPALQASIPMFVPEEALAKASGYSQAIQSISLIAGPALGAVAISFMKVNEVALIDILGAIVACSMLLLVKIPNPKRDENEEKQHIFKEMKVGLDALCKSKGIMWVVILNTVLTFAYMPINAFFPLMSKTHFSGDAISASIVEIVFAVGMLVGGLILGIWGGTKKKIHTLILGIFMLGISIFISGMLPSSGFVIFAIMSAVMGISASFANVIFNTILQTNIEKEKLGRVFSIIMGISVLAAPLGMLISGPVAEKFGITSWFIIAGIIIMVIGIACIAIKSVRTLEEKKLVEEENIV